VIPARRGPAQLSRSIKVVTTRVRPGYLRKNGVPYSANAVMTEYFDRLISPAAMHCSFSPRRLKIRRTLAQPYMIATHFKKQNDAAGWNPTPCAAK
jgi:hypothetical protein